MSTNPKESTDMTLVEQDEFAFPGTGSLIGRTAPTPQTDPAPAPQGPRPPSAKQIDFLKSLIRQSGVDDPGAVIEVLRQDGRAWTSVQFSKLIDAYKGHVAESTPRPAAAGTRTNKYAGQCSECGSTVAAEAGTLSRVNDKWVTAHKAGECVVSEPVQRRLVTNPPAPVVEIEHGFYAVGEQVYKVYPTRNGRTVTKTLSGASEAYGYTWDYSGTKPLRSIAAEGRRLTVEDAARYGHLTGQCFACGRHLTDEESIALGIGPVCRAKF